MVEKMSHEEARKALNIYVREEVNLRTIDVIEGVIDALHRGIAHSKRINIEIDHLVFHYPLTDILNHAVAMDLGQLEAPPWLARFRHLIQVIREEYDLHHPEENENQTSDKKE